MSEKNTFDIFAVCKGAAVAFAVTFAFVISLALVCYFFNVSDRLLSVLVLGCAGVSNFAGAVAAAKITGKNGLVHGAAVALCYILILFLSGAIASKGIVFDAHCIICFATYVCFGALGGILGVG